MGATGPAGPSGPTGPQGPAGANGVGHAYVYAADNSPLVVDNSFPVIASVTVPAGSYLIFGKTVVTNLDTSDQEANCILSTGDELGNGNGVALHLATVGNGGVTVPVSLQDTALNVPDNTTITMKCGTFSGGVRDPKLAGIAVNAI